MVGLMEKQTNQRAKPTTPRQYARARAKPPTTKWPRSGKKVKCPVCEQAGFPDPRPDPGYWANIHFQWHLKCPTCGRYVHARGWWQHNWMHPLPPDFIQALKDLPVVKEADQ